MGSSIGSNTAKDLYAAIGYQHTAYGMEDSKEDQFLASISWLPLKRLIFSGLANFTRQKYHQQYVQTLSGDRDEEYIVASIDRHTSYLTFRAELYLTPELSLQYYGSPYYSVGKYDSFKRVKQAAEKNFDDRFDPLYLNYNAVLDGYSFTYNSESFLIDNPDFSFMQFRSNLVLRWEYKLGSTLYMVWAHDRSGYETTYNPVSEIAGDLFGIRGNNVFMIKLNFWFSL